jgi:hypothetical protein
MLTYIAGSRYHPGAVEALSRIAQGSALALSREPLNPHDPRAVAVLDRPRGCKLGYVPRVDAPAVAKALESGYTVEAKLGGPTRNSLTITWEKPAQEVSL